MKIGAMIFATNQTIKVPRLAMELEARGYESLWIPEKTHLPTGSRTPWPDGDRLRSHELKLREAAEVCP